MSHSYFTAAQEAVIALRNVLKRRVFAYYDICGRRLSGEVRVPDDRKD